MSRSRGSRPFPLWLWSGIERAGSIGVRALRPIGGLLQRVPPVRFVAIATATLVLALSGFVAEMLVRGYQVEIAEAEHRIQDFTDVLAEHATLVFEDVDRTLEAANRERERLMRDGHWGPSAGDRPYQALVEFRLSTAAALNLSWTDEHGDRLYSAVSRSPWPLNTEALPEFRVHRDSASVGMYIGRPALSVQSGTYRLPVTRRFNLADGTFGGVTSTLVDPSSLATFYQSMTRRQRLFITLALLDGTVVVREPSLPIFMGMSVAAGPLFTLHLPKAPVGTFSAVSSIDGVERIISYRTLDKLPLVISVSINRADALAGWYQDRVVVLGFYAALVGLIVGGSWLIVLQLRRRAHRQREQEAAKERLRQAQKLQALGTLVGGIAHEINNALVPIMTLGEMAEEALPEGSFERDSVAQMRQSAQQIANLIKRVLAFSREEQASGSQLDLAGFVARLRQSLRGGLPGNIELVERVEPDIGAVQAGEEKLKQVFTDLVTNAAHAIGTEPGRIEISASAGFDAVGSHTGGGSAPVDYVRLAVKDDGPGIPPVVRERLFEPFFTTKAAGSGVGLGLYTARRVVTELGGYLDVESVPGKGACFSVYLPRAAAPGHRLQPA
ncbi:MAG: hypothetical protein HYR63_03580 [Proteobacteria bacterium]|nr:hypothetical protein [Pseudomonadota bacterium]MBI3498541.1 hypothetical protein [Pseudomonadota bacterium]